MQLPLVLRASQIKGNALWQIACWTRLSCFVLKAAKPYGPSAPTSAPAFGPLREDT